MPFISAACFGIHMSKQKQKYKLIQVTIEEECYDKANKLSNGKIGEWAKEAIISKLKEK